MEEMKPGGYVFCCLVRRCRRELKDEDEEKV